MVGILLSDEGADGRQRAVCGVPIGCRDGGCALVASLDHDDLVRVRVEGAQAVAGERLAVEHDDTERDARQRAHGASVAFTVASHAASPPRASTVAGALGSRVTPGVHGSRGRRSCVAALCGRRSRARQRLSSDAFEARPACCVALERPRILVGGTRRGLPTRDREKRTSAVCATL